MSDLIHKEDVIKIIDEEIKAKSDYLQHNAQIDIMYKVQELPTVEAKPVVHGSWETEFTAFLVVYRCSECNCATALGQTNFCPNCGADMGGGKND